MWLLDIINLVVLIFAYQKTCDQVNSNNILWLFYSIIGYFLGFIGLVIYTFAFHDYLESTFGKDYAIGSYIAASIIVVLAIGFLFMIGLKKVHLKVKRC